MIEVTAIATQGHPEEYKWVHKYHLKYALGAHWFEYRVNGEIKVRNLELYYILYFLLFLILVYYI